jgi:hypothetical protein
MRLILYHFSRVLQSLPRHGIPRIRSFHCRRHHAVCPVDYRLGMFELCTSRISYSAARRTHPLHHLHAEREGNLEQ